MSGNHEPRNTAAQKGKWKWDKKEVIPKSTKAHWRKTGRYPPSFIHPTENESNDIPHTTNAGLPTESIVNQCHNNGNRIPDPRPKAPDDGDIPMLENMVSAMDVSIPSDTDTESRESPPISNQDNIDVGDALDTHHNWVEERNEIMMDNEDQYVHLLRDDGAEVRDIVVQQEPIDPKNLLGENPKDGVAQTLRNKNEKGPVKAGAECNTNFGYFRSPDGNSIAGNPIRPPVLSASVGEDRRGYLANSLRLER
ncbi:hypothetical protein QAD02_002266 [Eretmocerus hayati]|uniref:Uncharacterized protein n=1 Tax=Eretmocerus hayati TaxID=131215 RepID=A0ACC2NLA7_9HYME|nr:hypothetical protein QAD02_002266 [Eretmocerus hayati]